MLTEEERERLSKWWLTGSEGDLFAVVEAILAARLAPYQEAHTRATALAEEWDPPGDHWTTPEGYQYRLDGLRNWCGRALAAALRLDPEETPC